MLYADLRDPLALLRGEGAAPALSRYWAYADGRRRPARCRARDVDAYSALMSASQPLVARGGPGRLPAARATAACSTSAAARAASSSPPAQRTPGLRLMLFDLPAVVAPAHRARFAALGPAAARARSFGGDFPRDALPRGADIASLVRVIHDHDDERALAILRAVRRALPPGGTLLLAEPMAGAPGAPRMGDAYFGFYLLAMRGGRAAHARPS